MMDSKFLSTGSSNKGVITQAWTQLSQVYQGTLYRLTPHTKARWAGAIVLILAFLLRILIKQGWYIVAYALGIYHLKLFNAFLTPKIDPAMNFDDDMALSTGATEEFRPFIRRLPEFKFWLSVSMSTIIGFICTFIDAFNVPVIWPILVMFFIILFCIKMKRQFKNVPGHSPQNYQGNPASSPTNCQLAVSQSPRSHQGGQSPNNYSKTPLSPTGYSQKQQSPLMGSVHSMQYHHRGQKQTHQPQVHQYQQQKQSQRQSPTQPRQLSPKHESIDQNSNNSSSAPGLAQQTNVTSKTLAFV